MLTLEVSPENPLVSRYSVVKTPHALGLQSQEVLIGFDDGPNPHAGVTAHLLEVLGSFGVSATFCVIGAYAAEQPELLARIYHEGHTLAFHSFHHRRPWGRNVAAMLREIEQFNRALQAIPGLSKYACRYYRPPYGMILPDTAQALAQHGLQLAPITFYVHDAWVRPALASQVMRVILRRIRQDRCAALVVHERLSGRRLTAKSRVAAWDPFNKTWVPGSIRWLIGELQQDGYRFVGMPELAARTMPSLRGAR